MGKRDRAERGTNARRRVSTLAEHATRLGSRLPGSRVATIGHRLWQRHVQERPDEYRASITFPTAPDRPTVAEIHDWIDGLEHAFEGHLDVYARRRSVAVVTDPVPAAHFDESIFDDVCERIEDGYADTHAVSHLEKWRRIDGRLVRSHVIVPVKPLFPRDEPAESGSRAVTGIEAD